MTRRTLLLVPFAARLVADSPQEVWDLFASMASALSEANAIVFMNAFEPPCRDTRRSAPASRPF